MQALAQALVQALVKVFVKAFALELVHALVQARVGAYAGCLRRFFGSAYVGYYAVSGHSSCGVIERGCLKRRGVTSRKAVGDVQELPVWFDRAA